jgi:hypothetical protein
MINLEDGKTYATAKGDETFIRLILDPSDDDYPFCGEDGNTYTPEGRFILGENTPVRDLISLVEDKPTLKELTEEELGELRAAFETPSTISTTSLEVQDTVITPEHFGKWYESVYPSYAPLKYFLVGFYQDGKTLVVSDEKGNFSRLASKHFLEVYRAVKEPVYSQECWVLFDGEGQPLGVHAEGDNLSISAAHKVRVAPTALGV